MYRVKRSLGDCLGETEALISARSDARSTLGGEIKEGARNTFVRSRGNERGRGRPSPLSTQAHPARNVTTHVELVSISGFLICEIDP
jgi:hypothetical protein